MKMTKSVRLSLIRLCSNQDRICTLGLAHMRSASLSAKSATVLLAFETVSNSWSQCATTVALSRLLRKTVERLKSPLHYSLSSRRAVVRGPHLCAIR